jgi:translation elongation factor EF-Tu-like GTPase
MALPGDSVEMTVELGKPVAMTEGLGFAIVKAGGCRAVFLPSVHKGGISGGNPPGALP